MNSLLILFLVFTLGVNDTNVSEFAYSNYVNEDYATMLEVQYVQDVASPELINTLEDFLANHFNDISHVSAHYAKETDMFYYAVFGQKDGSSKVDLVEVPKENALTGTFYEYKQPLAFGSCRRGNGYPYPPVCPGTTCQTWGSNNCLGIICHYTECW